ncbi:MAG TPA: hypothetical protein VHH36_06725 [Candidatus Thermoplasmatota archaeon]|nr:hypothetical protein [Candidatus Thermoplasmatota archaeon]
MGLRTWWLESRLRRTDVKLRVLHAQQKRLREKEAILATEKRRGLPSTEAKAREDKIRAERERLAAAIARVHAEQDDLKAALRDAGVAVAH